MIFLILFLLFGKCYAAKPGHYECGQHGRFEYCIDDFPGCVVGCHCYPGYYFDTEAKICEPNSKLTQGYRRQMPAPVPAYNLPEFSAPIEVQVTTPAPQITSPDDLGPDPSAGDLSDWLYNQFFKTIESQVVNKTDENEPMKAPTRRSGAPLEPFGTFTRRHLSSKRRKSKKSRKSKKRSSRKKITRADDDDSDDDSDEDSSSSSSSSESESDSSSDESKGNLGSWERFEGGGVNPGEQNDRGDAAHREIVMYSKKPKPPLPSFIFLPNVGAPFYPPIGLPAPMYPIAPIPPLDYCPENVTTSAATTQASTTTTTPTVTTTTATTPTNTPSTPPTVTPPNNRKRLLRNRPPPFLQHPRARKKLPHRPPPISPPEDYPMETLPQDSDYDNLFAGENNLLLGKDKGDYTMDNDSPANFNYISDLIHRDRNVTTPQPTWKQTPNDPDKPFNMKPLMAPAVVKKLPILPGRLDQPTRRKLDPVKKEKDESYYSSLGKQIAKLIRGLEPNSVNKANKVKVEPVVDDRTAHPYFSESSFSARTYWDRYVRSPLSLRLKNFTEYEDLIASNEELFELENQVQDVTAAPALSWLQLENVINTLQVMRNHINLRALNTNYTKPSNDSLNVSLLPKIDTRRYGVPKKPKIEFNTHTLSTSQRPTQIIPQFINQPKHLTISNHRQVYTDTPKARNNHTNKQVHSDIPKKLTEEVPLDNLNLLKLHSMKQVYLAQPKVRNDHAIDKLHFGKPRLNERMKNSNPKRLLPKNLLRPVYSNTNLHHLRFITTIRPVRLSTLIKGQQHVTIDFNEKNGLRPHLISFGGDAASAKSNKYFFDHGGSYHFVNWT